MARGKAVPVLRHGQASGGKTAPGKKSNARRKGAMVLAAAAVDRGAAALARKWKGGTDEEVDELEQAERGEGEEEEEEAMEEEEREEEGEEEEGEGTVDIEEQENQGEPSRAQNKRRSRSKVFHVALLLLSHTFTDIICTYPDCQNSV